MRYYKHPTTIQDNKTHRTVYKTLAKKEKRRYVIAKFFGNVGRFLSVLTAITVMAVAIYVSKNHMHPFAEGVFWNVLNGIVKFAFCTCCLIVGCIIAFLIALPVSKLEDKFSKDQKDILRFKATEHLRTAYKLTEPCLVTKCYECKGNDTFNRHDVCIFAVDDELRITTNLLHGFFNPENDLGCYAFSRDEITLELIEYEQTTAATLSCEEITFILGQRAYSFIQRHYLKLQAES